MDESVKVKRVKWKDRTTANDIKYGGFLSYRHLRIIGWACLVIAQISVILTLYGNLHKEAMPTIGRWNEVLSWISSLPIPLFMLSNFGIILQKKGDFRSLFIRYGAAAAGLYILGNVVVMHYGHQFVHALNPENNMWDSLQFFGTIMPMLGKSGYLFNVMVDMLLCVLLFFFMNYVPTKYFQGKKLLIFRFLVLLPIAYEIGAIFLRYFLALGEIWVPSFVFFLIPSKPPLLFVGFVIIVIMLKIAEARYLKKPGHTKETYADYVSTNAHSLRTSIGITIVFLIMATLDLLFLFVGIYFVLGGVMAFVPPDASPDDIEFLTTIHLQAFENTGFGGSVGLYLIAPLIILFSYKKTHANPRIDILIPIAGIGLMIFLYIEGAFQVLTSSLYEITSRLASEEETSSQDPSASTEVLSYAIASVSSWLNGIRLQ